MDKSSFRQKQVDLSQLWSNEQIEVDQIRVVRSSVDQCGGEGSGEWFYLRGWLLGRGAKRDAPEAATAQAQRKWRGIRKVLNFLQRSNNGDFGRY